ncbi:helix-turn-helix domain-containing protein [Pedobacter xixiisoli]|uniref:helix-turn-helix domain-containing protein n=1 Tax=Pedobacter xixiisoli TaxID=1476464 RepID=UPI0014866B06|nr:helix-turn-helix domain-containing protein [Pedobacter xixiisoli]
MKKYIEGYYFIASSEEPTSLHYWTFPNNFFIVSVNANADIQVEENKIVVKESEHENLVANYVSRYTNPIEVNCEGAINEITIYFKPLGIHHFMANADELILQKSALCFNPFPDFKETMAAVLKQKDRMLQRDMLEQYWLSKLRTVELSLLEKVIIDIEADLRIDGIAKKHNFSRQYLNKLFTQGVGKSPTEYRKIHRFRNAIAKRKETDSLTELSYESLFYDQSHLIKDFKQLAKVSPNAFFKKVDTNKGYIWLFI